MVPGEQCLSVSFSCSRTAITVFNPSLLQAVMRVTHAKSMHLTQREEQYLPWTCDGRDSPKCLLKQTLNTCGQKMRMVYPGGLVAEHKQFPQVAGRGQLRKVHSSDFLFQQALWSALEMERHALLGAD